MSVRQLHGVDVQETLIYSQVDADLLEAKKQLRLFSTLQLSGNR
jgi:hypothetical protein